MDSNKEKDFQTLSFFAILVLLTFLFVLGSRVVLYAPISENIKIVPVEDSKANR